MAEQVAIKHLAVTAPTYDGIKSIADGDGVTLRLTVQHLLALYEAVPDHMRRALLAGAA